VSTGSPSAAAYNFSIQGPTKYAFGVDRFARSLAGEINGEHLMSFKGNWKAEVERIFADPSAEVHFDLTDLTLSENLSFNEFSSILSKPVSNTQWEISILYNNYNSQFQKTYFYLNKQVYKGKSIFDALP
jgi:hypothetical protein